MSDKVWIKLPGGAQGWGCECMARTLPLIEADMKKQGLIKRCLDVFQWGYNPGKVSKSAGTHDLGGVIDVAQFSLAQRKVWAKWGVMMFPRTRAFGWTSGDHGHGVWHGCPHQTPYTDWQVRSGLAGGDGLGSSATLKGRRWRKFGAPVRTWQEAVKLYGSKPQVQSASAPKSVTSSVKAATTTAANLISFAAYNKPGFSGNRKIVQGWLKRIDHEHGGLYKGEPNGLDDATHRAAVKAYQLLIGDRGTAADGKLGPKQFARLAQWGKMKAGK